MSNISTPLRTPLRVNANQNNLSTPLFVPPSPMLQELGYGTGKHRCYLECVFFLNFGENIETLQFYSKIWCISYIYLFIFVKL